MSTLELLAGVPHILAVVALVVGPTMLLIVFFTNAGRVAKLRIEVLEEQEIKLDRERRELRRECNDLRNRLENMTTVAANYCRLLEAATGEIAYLREDLGRLDAQARRAPTPKPAKDRQIEPAAPTPVEPAPTPERPNRWELLEIDR